MDFVEIFLRNGQKVIEKIYTPPYNNGILFSLQHRGEEIS